MTKSRKRVSFSDELEHFYVPAYSTMYGCHPRFISATCDGWKSVSSHADPYTSKSGLVMRSRCAKVHDPQRRSEAAEYRRRFLRKMVTALINALTNTDAVSAIRTPPAKKHGVKRAGAKAVKAMERVSTEYTLSPEDATNFRALSARANFLSQDRTDIGFSTKELCREFAVPNRNSYNRLKRVARYLIGKPRLVYNYRWGVGVSEDDCFDIYVDTDFAGCKETRRSTSGGACMLGGSNVKNGRRRNLQLRFRVEKQNPMGLQLVLPKGWVCNPSQEISGSPSAFGSIPMQRLHWGSADDADLAKSDAWMRLTFGAKRRFVTEPFSSSRSSALIIRPT